MANPKQLLALLLLSSTLAAAPGRVFAASERAFSCDATAKLFARLVFTSDHDLQNRPGFQELLRLYKNDPAFHHWLNAHAVRGSETPAELMARFRREKPLLTAPADFEKKTVNLQDSPALEDPHPELCRICDWQVQQNRSPREYAYRVMSLKKGDTVVFDGARFTLGNFLGRGNATHVWEIEGEPGAVLKIPFYSGPPEGKRGGDTRTLNYFGPQSGRMFATLFKAQEDQLRDLDIPKVRTLEAGRDFSYLKVSRVPGSQNGREFLLNEFRADPANPQIAAKHALLLKRVLQLLHFRARLGVRALSFKDEELVFEARQFVYDGKDWVLVDWE